MYCYFCNYYNSFLQDTVYNYAQAKRELYESVGVNRLIQTDKSCSYFIRIFDERSIQYVLFLRDRFFGIANCFDGNFCFFTRSQKIFIFIQQEHTKTIYGEVDYDWQESRGLFVLQKLFNPQCLRGASGKEASLVKKLKNYYEYA